jgi:hypothetical protein
VLFFDRFKLVGRERGGGGGDDTEFLGALSPNVLNESDHFTSK